MWKEQVYLKCDTKDKVSYEVTHFWGVGTTMKEPPVLSITHILRGCIPKGSPAPTCEVRTSNLLLFLCIRNVCRNWIAQINNIVLLLLHGLFQRWWNLCLLPVLPTLHGLPQDSYSWLWGSLKEVLNTVSWTWAVVKTFLTILTKVLNPKFFPKLELTTSFYC